MQSSREKNVLKIRVINLMTRNFYMVKVQLQIHLGSQKAGSEIQFLDLFVR